MKNMRWIPRQLSRKYCPNRKSSNSCRTRLPKNNCTNNKTTASQDRRPQTPCGEWTRRKCVHTREGSWRPHTNCVLLLPSNRRIHNKGHTEQDKAKGAVQSQRRYLFQKERIGATQMPIPNRNI